MIRQTWSRARAQFVAMCAALLVCMSPGQASAQGEPRFALVIGNEAYSGALTPLNRPYEDADLIGNALRTTGFSVTPRKDQGRSDILKEVRTLADRLKQAGPNAIGFFYYSGHGASAQVGSRRQNFLIPTGSSIADASELISDGVPLDTIISLLEQSGAKAVFIVFDACRSELPWSKGGTDPDKAFNSVAARPGLFIAFSTDAGATAPDDGLFSSALAAQLVKPNTPHVLAFDEAALAVGKTRGTDRLPWYSNQIPERIYFAPSMEQSPSAKAWLSLNRNDSASLRGFVFQFGTSPEARLAQEQLAALDASAWAFAQREDTVRSYRVYLEQFPATATPAGAYAKLASDRIVALTPKPSIAPAAGTVFRDCGQCPELVMLRAGSFMLGSPEAERSKDQKEASYSFENLPTKASVTRRIAIGTAEVTWDEWEACVAAAGCNNAAQTAVGGDEGWGRATRPVINVTWADAQSYTAWLSKMTGESYRLPSEAEWEYAARAGTTGPYWWPSANQPDAQCFACRAKSPTDRTAPTRSFAANPFGLFDTAGNVRELTADCFAKEYKPSIDGSPIPQQGCTYRAVRGGGWRDRAGSVRSAVRFQHAQSSRSDDVGFRVVREFQN